MGQQHEKHGVDRRTPRVADEGVECRGIGFGGGVTAQLARERVDGILQRPARYDEVEPHDEQRRDHAVVAQEPPCGRQRAVGADRIAVRGAAHRELRQQNGQPQQQDAERIDQQKRSAAVLAGDIGEAPDVAQPHRTPGCHQDGAQLAAERGSLVCFHDAVVWLSLFLCRSFGAQAAAGDCGSPGNGARVRPPDANGAAERPDGRVSGADVAVRMAKTAPGPVGCRRRQCRYRSRTTLAFSTFPPSGGASFDTVQRMRRICGNAA